MTRRARRFGLVAACALLGALASPRDARAEGELALNRFHPAPAGDRFFSVPSPYVAGAFDLHAMALVEYAYRPLLLRYAPENVSAIVTHQAVLHADLTLGIGNRALFNVDLPLLSLQEGDTEPALDAASFGDVRLGGRVKLFGDNAAPLQMGLGGYLWVPTAGGAVVGDGKVRGMPYLSAGGLSGALLWSAMVGSELRFAQKYEGLVDEGSSLDLGGGLAYLVDKPRRLQIGLETTASVVLAHPAFENLNAELLFQGRYRFLDRFEVGAGVGPGLSTGIGTPSARGLLFFAYVPVADLKRRWEPTPTRDGASADALFSGAARLRDRDPARAEPSPPQVDDDAARIVSDQVIAGEGILFDVGSAALTARAVRQLHAIADLLVAHPEIRRVELRGHADIHGTLPHNEQLGASRAAAVRSALIRHSVAPERLAVATYGPSAPARSSVTAEGMRLNRRVEVWIVERSVPAP